MLTPRHLPATTQEGPCVRFPLTPCTPACLAQEGSPGRQEHSKARCRAAGARHVCTLQLRPAARPCGREQQPRLHTTLTAAPPGAARRLPVNGTERHMDGDTEQAVQLLATCARGIVPCNATWAVAIVLCMRGGPGEPIGMLFLSTHKKENHS